MINFELYGDYEDRIPNPSQLRTMARRLALAKEWIATVKEDSARNTNTQSSN